MIVAEKDGWVTRTVEWHERRKREISTQEQKGLGECKSATPQVANLSIIRGEQLHRSKITAVQPRCPTESGTRTSTEERIVI